MGSGGLLPDHHARIRADRRVRHRRLWARAQQDDRRRPQRARRAASSWTAASRSTDRRWPAAGGPRRQDKPKNDAPRRSSARRTTAALRRHLRRVEYLRVRRQVERRTPTPRSRSARNCRWRRSTRSSLRAQPRATACRSRASRPDPVSRHPVLPAAADLAARLPQLRHYETMVTNQSVEARPESPGVRWYEIRRTNGAYTVHQQGTFAPNDGVHRWMGSDRDGPATATLPWATASSTARTCSRASATPAVSPAIRSARCPSARDHRRHRRADDHELPMGRLHVDERRSRGRLHILVRQRVLHGGRPSLVDGWLANAHRQLQAARLLGRASSTAERAPAPLRRNRRDRATAMRAVTRYS